MKKLIAVAFLSVAGLGLQTGQASAWIFNPFCKSKCVICVKPYNAFSPVCFGSVCCDGFYPIGTQYPYPYHQQLPPIGPFCHGDGFHGDLIGHPVDGHSATDEQPADAGTPDFQSPSPTPVQPNGGTTSQLPPSLPYAPYGAAGYYRPAYYPGYNPGFAPGYNPGYAPGMPAGYRPIPYNNAAGVLPYYGAPGLPMGR